MLNSSRARHLPLFRIFKFDGLGKDYIGKITTVAHGRHPFDLVYVDHNASSEQVPPMVPLPDTTVSDRSECSVFHVEIEHATTPPV